MKRTFVFLVAIALLLTSAVMAGHGQRGSHDGGHHRGHGDRSSLGMILMKADEIGLSESQEKQIKQAMEENALNQVDLRAKLEKAELKLHFLKMNEASEIDILMTIEKVGHLRTEMHKMKFKQKNGIRSILTDDQLEKVRKIRREMMKCGEGSRFKGRGVPRGKGDCDSEGPRGYRFGLAPVSDFCKS